MKKNLLLLLLLAAPFALAHAQFKRKPKQPQATTVALPQEKISESWFCYAIFNNQAAEENVKIADLDYRNGKVEQWEVFDQKGQLNYTYLFDQDPSSNQIKRFIKQKDNTITLDYIETYNQLHQLSQRDIYNDQKQVTHSTLWDYNALGQIVRQTDKQLINNKMITTYEIQYDHLPEIYSTIETHTNHQTKQSHQIAIAFNDNRQPTEESHYKTTGELITKTTYYYDDQNRLVEKRFYPDGQALEIRETYAYSSLNNEVVHATYTQQGEQLTEYIVYKYEYK